MAEKAQDTMGSTSMNFRLVRLRKRGWQLTTPYTDPCRPKRARSASHKFKPDEPVDAEMLAEYLKFKEDPTGSCNFVQLKLQSYMVNWWDKLMHVGTRDTPFLEWPVLSYKWTNEQLAWARENNEDSCRPWKEVDTLLIPVNTGGGHWLMARVELTLRSIRLYDPWQQEV
ncbi:hypothetical protein Ddye_024550 [Dipteronia dyeriana]|uniref:Ubiquitin-like protease family profile domain-containing protein n=1 Tax=Dipteronia dyeriana TaxID=168575 RepID=A0AAD9TV59_9ROSI|nr:hypothetical protein Ddye_024550 [Dipteronia dyeriana]